MVRPGFTKVYEDDSVVRPGWVNLVIPVMRDPLGSFDL